MASIAPPAHNRNKSTTDSWITPPWIIEVFGPFDLDPCACDPQPWPCAGRQYTEADNGLLLPWEGFVYANPPYGKALGPWLNRCALHNNGIALVFARTETKAFFDNVWPYASAILFLRGRVTFYTPEGTRPREGHSSGGPSILIGYGKEAQLRLWSGRKFGKFIPLNS